MSPGETCQKPSGPRRPGGVGTVRAWEATVRTIRAASVSRWVGSSAASRSSNSSQGRPIR